MIMTRLPMGVIKLGLTGIVYFFVKLNLLKPTRSVDTRTEILQTRKYHTHHLVLCVCLCMCVYHCIASTRSVNTTNRRGIYIYFTGVRFRYYSFSFFFSFFLAPPCPCIGSCGKPEKKNKYFIPCGDRIVPR